MSIEPRPLSKEEREEIIRESGRIGYVAKDTSGFGEDIEPLLGMIVSLLAAERFWREAVQRTDGDRECDGRSSGCHFCADGPPHRPDCPWLLAQDNEEGGRE